jgi:hypothetical protein
MNFINRWLEAGRPYMTNLPGNVYSMPRSDYLSIVSYM